MQSFLSFLISFLIKNIYFHWEESLGPGLTKS